MIHLMYGFDYDSSGSDHSRVSPMLFNVNVYQVADKYGVPNLKERAKEKFEKIIETCWEMDDFPLTITEAYSSTPKTDRGLRDPFIRTALKHIEHLLKTEDFVQVLEETVGFSADIFQYSISQSTNPSLTKYRCSNCGNRLQRARWMRAPPPALRTMDSHLLVVSGVSTHHLMRKPRRIPRSGCVDASSWSPNASAPARPHEMVDDYKE